MDEYINAGVEHEHKMAAGVKDSAPEILLAEDQKIQQLIARFETNLPSPRGRR